MSLRQAKFCKAREDYIRPCEDFFSNFGDTDIMYQIVEKLILSWTLVSKIDRLCLNDQHLTIRPRDICVSSLFNRKGWSRVAIDIVDKDTAALRVIENWGVAM